MPASITHQLVAEKVFSLLDDKIKPIILDLGAYYTGAQGGDPFFLYKPLSKHYNLGKKMHRENPLEFFTQVKAVFSTLSPVGKSYYLGYITHYATDTLFHPFVYGLERHLKSQGFVRKKDNPHFLIEKDIDVFLYQEVFSLPAKNYRLPFFPNENTANYICDALNKVVWPLYNLKLDKGKLYKALKRFFSSQQTLCDKSGIRRGAVYFTESILFLPHTLSGLFMRNTPDLRFTNYKKEVTPYSPNGDSIFDLFDKSIEKSIILINDFLSNKKDLTGFTEEFNKGKRNK
jgi:hypothetical protein